MLIFDNVSVKYGKKSVLENISFRLNKGEITAVIGKNGCGKSTLVSCAAALLKYEGDITFQGKCVSDLSPRERAKNMSLLPQQLNPVPITVEELVAMGRNPHIDLTNRLNETDQKYIDHAINVMGLDGLRHKFVNQISGGECRKAYIAMVLAQNTELVILDEPTAYMDPGYVCAFSDIIINLKESFKKTVLVVSHDISSVCEFADRIILIDDKKIKFNGSVSQFTKSGIAEQIFKVKRIDYNENGVNKVLYR